jgi:hypothetical protein
VFDLLLMVSYKNSWPPFRPKERDY